ncbi:MAG TPA: beta-galactosidase [Candidatus Thermoplasmatota archaeon]|nr:beta-galactosidase [Candidatus Thermoplasmatota archaeon]
MTSPRLVDGVLVMDGRPRPFLATDYPYFRDDVRHWRDRLRAQKAAGLDIVSVYVPWRHHAPREAFRGGGAYDFTGRTQPNRDVVGLLDIAREEGLFVVLKPGPFVHAELPYGGLPDDVCPECHPENAIEPELDADGVPIRWILARMEPRSQHILPAPFGEAYLAYVRDWLEAVAREVAAPAFHPQGPVIGVQLMNEGIYSDSAKAEPHQLGYASSSRHLFHDFLASRYRDLDAYNRIHGTRHRDWHAVVPPRRARLLASARALLPYLDWSAFQAEIYALAAEAYRGFLVSGGLPRDAFVLFNFNPNGTTYRERPASNDGWYTRVNVADVEGLTFGSTNWLGVVAGDPVAFRQYAMATTAFRGPAMEQNWGFASQYFAPYEYVTPSHFESMLAVACGATGITAYTFAGARAWRDDPNLAAEWIPERTNDRRDATSGDYPGDSAVLSDGTRTPKLATLHQIAHVLAAIPAEPLVAGPRAAVAWAMYPPYAWAGQWLPRGDPDDLLWRPPLKAVPRGAYHGLDAFVEMMMDRGLGFRQLDISREDVPLERVDAIALSAHEYMDAATQLRLARFVEDGGALMLTGLVPDRDLTLKEARGALSGLFPHRVRRVGDVAHTRRATYEGRHEGLALDFFVEVEPPGDADAFVRLGEDVVGYRRSHGAGRVFYLGIGPWRARHSGDDPRVARENQRFAWRILEGLGADDCVPARPLDDEHQVMVWQHGARSGGPQALYIVVRDAHGTLRVRYTEPGGRAAVATIASPSEAVHVAAFDAAGRLVAAHLKGVNDVRGEAVAPSLAWPGGRLAAATPCDVAFVRSAREAVLTVAHVAGSTTRVVIPLAPHEIAGVARADGGAPRVYPLDGATAVEIEDLARGGFVRFALAPRATPKA